MINDFLKNIKNISSSIETQSIKIINEISEIDKDIFDLNVVKIFYDKDNVQTLKSIMLVLVFGVLLYFVGKKIIIIYEEYDNNYMSKIIIKGIILILIATNSNYLLEEIIGLNDLFTQTIASVLSDVSKEEISYEKLSKEIYSVEEFFENKYKFKFQDSGKIISSFLLLYLVCIFSIRYTLIIIYIIIFPFSFIFLFFDKYKFLFYNLFNFFISNLLIQSVNKIIIFIPIASKKEDIYDIILIGTLWVLYMVNKNCIRIGDIWKR